MRKVTVSRMRERYAQTVLTFPITYVCIYIYIYTHTYNDVKWNQKNMEECDKRKSHVSSKLHMIYISSNSDRHPVTKNFTPLHPTTRHYTSLHLFSHLNFTQLHFTPLHYTCRHFTSSHLNFTQLHFTNLSISLTPFKFPTEWQRKTTKSFETARIPAQIRAWHLTIAYEKCYHFRQLAA